MYYMVASGTYGPIRTIFKSKLDCTLITLAMFYRKNFKYCDIVRYIRCKFNPKIYGWYKPNFFIFLRKFWYDNLCKAQLE